MTPARPLVLVVWPVLRRIGYAGVVGAVATALLAGVEVFALLIAWASRGVSGWFALLFAVVVLVGAVVVLREGTGGRTSTAVVVVVLGELGWLAGAWLDSELGDPVPATTTAAIGLGAASYALAAAVTGGGRTAVVALVLAIAVPVTGYSVVSIQRSNDVRAEQLAALERNRAYIYVVEIPGYVNGSDDSSRTQRQFTPTDIADAATAEVRNERMISLGAAPGAFSCGSTPMGSPTGAVADVTCEPDGPQLWYEHGTALPPGPCCPDVTYPIQTYVRVDAGTVLTVSASSKVPRETLRQAVLTAHRATDNDLIAMID